MYKFEIHLVNYSTRSLTPRASKACYLQSNSRPDRRSELKKHLLIRVIFQVKTIILLLALVASGFSRVLRTMPNEEVLKKFRFVSFVSFLKFLE